MKASLGTSAFSNNGFEQFDNPPAGASVDTSDVTLDDTTISNSEA